MKRIYTTKTPDMTRRKVVKTLALGGLVMAAAGPLSMTHVRSWSPVTLSRAFTAVASGQVDFTKAGLGQKVHTSLTPQRA